MTGKNIWSSANFNFVPKLHKTKNFEPQILYLGKHFPTSQNLEDGTIAHFLSTTAVWSGIIATCWCLNPSRISNNSSSRNGINLLSQVINATARNGRLSAWYWCNCEIGRSEERTDGKFIEVRPNGGRSTVIAASCSVVGLRQIYSPTPTPYVKSPFTTKPLADIFFENTRLIFMPRRMQFVVMRSLFHMRRQMLFLSEKFCLPLLSYCCEGLVYCKQQISQLNVLNVYWSVAHTAKFLNAICGSLSKIHSYVNGWVHLLFVNVQ